MKILLAGGNGYVGSKLSAVLLKYGYDVHICDLNWFGDHAPPGATTSQEDLFKIDRSFLSGFDQVIFLAGLSNDPMAECKPALNFKMNAALPAYLCHEAKRALVRRFIYASSCSVYGFAWDKTYTEDDKLHCNFPYGISKYQGEVGCLEQADDNFSVIALRKGTISGYAPRMRLDLVINTMTKCGVHDGKITVNNPALWRPVLSINDAVSAYLRAIQAPLNISGAFNVAGDNVTIGGLGETVHKCLEANGIKCSLELQNKPDLRNYRVNTKKAESVLGFYASDTVSDIVSELLNNHESWKCVDLDFFYNARMCQKLLV